MSETGESKLGDLSATESTGHSTAWKVALIGAIVVALGRLALVVLRPGAGSSLSGVATVVTVLAVVAAAIVIPMQVMRARSAEQVTRAAVNSPGSVVVAAIRSPLGKRDFEWIDPAFHPNLFYTVTVNEEGLTIWEGGRNAKPVLRVARDQIASVETTNLRLGSVTYPAVRLVFNHVLDVPAAVSERYPTQFTAEFFLRKPSRPQRPRPATEVNAAANDIARALS